MKDFSLLYPEGKKPDFVRLSENACNDLSLDEILDFISETEAEKKILKRMTTELESDPEVIRYRCDIFEDILTYPQLREKINDMLEQLDYLKNFDRSFKDESVAPVWQLVNRLLELEAYIDCISGIYNVLTDCPIRSEGLKRLREYVSSVYNENRFACLKADIQELLTETGRIKSITLGVNLDDMLRPVEVGIMSINKEKFECSKILENFFASLPIIGDMINGRQMEAMTKIRTYGKTSGEDPLMKNLSRTVTDMLGSTVRHLKSRLSRYANISSYGLTKFIPEFLFYTRWAEFCRKLIEAGLPMSRPEILDTENRELFSKGIYNIKLALHKLDEKDTEIVLNDFEFSRENGIYIMTGPNRGGKTTFTQAVGWLFLLAQHGIYVPAENLSLSPCDNIFTHFPADENKTVDLGRLGEESKRLSEIFSEATENSVLLFNEPLATTSFAEGLYIARDVVEVMRFLGARAVFNTHMHELAMQLDRINACEGSLKVSSLVTGIHDGKRSYKVFIAPPEGVSYARDIAEKYGVTVDQLKNGLKKPFVTHRAIA